MKEFIQLQYQLYQSGSSNLSLEVIRQLAQTYMTEEEQKELFDVD